MCTLSGTSDAEASVAADFRTPNSGVPKTNFSPLEGGEKSPPKAQSRVGNEALVRTQEGLDDRFVVWLR